MAVYFIQCEESKLIKIGSSNRPLDRIKGIQAGCPGNLTMLKIVEGGRKDEFGLHKRFADARVRGEWFQPSPELLAEIEKTPAAVDVDPPWSPPTRKELRLMPYLEPGRKPEPRWYASRGGWYVCIKGRQYRLAIGKEAKDKAWENFHRLMAYQRDPITGRFR